MRLTSLIPRRLATRTFSSGSPLESFLASDAQVIKSTAPPVKYDLEGLKFGQVFTSHMLEIPWTMKGGWEKPLISPFHDLQLSPAVPALHYAIECFEGMKAYRDSKNPEKIRLFRPDQNMNRLLTSCQRLCLPSFDRDELLKLIQQLVILDKDYIPNRDGYSLYIRPTVIATDKTIGVAVPKRALMFVILSPAGPYYPRGFQPIRLLASTEYVRAWKGGAGGFKVGSNYAPGIYPQRLAQEKGFDQVLWLYGADHRVTEVGTMNFFFFIENNNGEKELVTAPLDGTILPGVTRSSVLALTRRWNEFKVSERYVTMDEIAELNAKGKVLEAFGAGTAAIIAPVKHITFDSTPIDLPLDPNDPSQQAGPLSRRLLNTILDIQYGRTPHEWSVQIN